MGADAGVHAHSGIRDGEHRVGPGHGPEVRLRVGLIEVDIGGFDRQRAALRHRIAGIHREIHDHLLELIGIGADVPEIGREHGNERNVLTNEAA